MARTTGKDHARNHLATWGVGGRPRNVDAGRPSSWRGPDHCWFVYTMYEAQMRLAVPLYVGVTSQLYERLSHHRRDRDWWPLVGNIVVEHFNNRSDAFEAEELRIHRMRPLFNVVGNIHTPGVKAAAI